MRLTAQIKMGYYPTPDVVVNLIRPMLEFPSQEFPVLDPCCGTGKALADLVAGTAAVTYGIELDLGRAREADKHLNCVAKGAFEQATVAKNAFSLVLLNPPYDADTSNFETRRKEHTFLRETTPLLVDEGILVYIVPQQRISPQIAKHLDYSYEAISCWRFPPKEYRDFIQVVILAKKKKIKHRTDSSTKSLFIALTTGKESVDAAPPTRKWGSTACKTHRCS
ncbi:MAG TPA: class I SAM-dependent methyltransferase [Firmicutes bacterium]|nr:class I SAM-dependent methyltransferase [Candidatus Fermentithermobacillaceae bacterium]